ncbi:diacylglycerol O-acyltransferase 2 [Puma concolor]|uniref:Acyltransferase n=1 Tax=Puma concolor TaxID=9696 RepID=A0A6P6I931_PUMCO|nr:diacylglycerol O-acyltransferase 2 [Puma concolor]
MGRSVLLPAFDGDVHKMTVHCDAHSDGEGGMRNCGGLMVLIEGTGAFLSSHFLSTHSDIQAFNCICGTGSSILSALQDIFSVTWLNRSKVEKQLQVISVLQWVLSFLVLGVACSAILMYTFCTDCWLIAVLYFTWLAFDWNTPKKGGRRSQWVRNWAVWRYFRDYFPIQLVKTHNLLTTRNYIIGYHPHGIMGLGAFCNFSTEATEVSKKFPGIRPYLATLAGNFRMPVLREYLMSGGICPVNRDTIDYLLSKNGSGNAIIIVVGGAAESLSSMPGKNAVTLRNRKGFVKLALRHGADLVPTYSFGENEVYKQVIFEEGSWGRWVQKKFQKYIGFAPCIFHGRGLFSSDTWGLVPYSKPITTIVGEPITIPKLEHPTQQDIDLYHSMYMEALVKLFDKHKTKFGLPETEVLEVN